MLRCDRISSSNARKPACEYDSGNFIEQAIIYLHAHKQKHTHSYRRLRIYFNMISIPYFFLHTLSPTFPRPCIYSVCFSYLSLFHSVSLSFKRSFRFTLYKSSFFSSLNIHCQPPSSVFLFTHSFFLVLSTLQCHNQIITQLTWKNTTHSAVSVFPSSASRLSLSSLLFRLLLFLSLSQLLVTTPTSITHVWAPSLSPLSINYPFFSTVDFTSLIHHITHVLCVHEHFQSNRSSRRIRKQQEKNSTRKKSNKS